MAPVTVFLVAIACLLIAAAAVRPLALRSGVPEAMWLILLGVGLRATGLVSTATIAALAPFFAAIALIMVLFEAGRDMVFGAAGEQVGRARKLALVGAAMVVPLVALFSQALSGLQLLPPTWSWTHAFMLGALMLCTAPEVYAPTLYRRGHPGLVATLEREAAITGALAIAATAFCIDLLSLRVPAGKAYAAIAAGFGLGLAFGAFAGLLWITAIRRVGPGRGVYPYTLAAILALYVVTDTLGGIGALAVLVFGAVVSNAGPLVAQLFRPRGTIVEAADEDFRAALDDHGRTVEITRVLLFTFLGLGLGPPWGLVAMGIVLGLLLVVLRLLAARLVLRGVDDRTFSTLALGWPRGMLVAGLAALPHAAAVPGTESLTTLVFAAVATTCVAFAVAVSPLGHAHLAEDRPKGAGPKGQGPGDMSPGTGAGTVVRAQAPAPTVDEVLGRAAAVSGGEGRAHAGGTSSGAASEPRAEGFAAEPVVRGRTVVAEPAVSGRTVVAEPVVSEAPVVSGRTVVAEPVVSESPVVVEEPVVSGRTVVAAAQVIERSAEPAVSERPEEPVVSGRTVIAEPVVSGRTVVPDGLLASARLVVEEPVVSGRTLVPGEPVSGRSVVEEPVVSGRTLVPGEPAPGKTGAEVPRFAPPGASRSAERTVLRGSATGAPELVRHVFISAPATTNVGPPVTRAPESSQAQASAVSEAAARGSMRIDALAPTEPSAAVQAARTSGSTVIDALPARPSAAVAAPVRASGSSALDALLSTRPDAAVDMAARAKGTAVDALPVRPSAASEAPARGSTVIDALLVKPSAASEAPARGSTVIDALPAKPSAVMEAPVRGSTVIDALPVKPSAVMEAPARGSTVIDALPVQPVSDALERASGSTVEDASAVREDAGQASAGVLEVAVTFAASEAPESTLKAPVVAVETASEPHRPEATTAPATGKEPPLLELLNEALLPPRGPGETKEG